MQVGEVRVAEDADFDVLKIYLTRNDGWKTEYSGANVTVWTRSANDASLFKMIRLRTTFSDVRPSVVFDVLQDPVYRKTWDKYMLETKDVGHLNPNNNISYYALGCPSPIKNRDFVIESSWLETNKELMIINHSVFHKDFPPRKGFVRATSFLTGFLISANGRGCDVGYVTHSDPRGHLPTWVTNKLSSSLAPRMVRRLHKACLKYEAWKARNAPTLKPWVFPEQIDTPRIKTQDCTPPLLSVDDSSPDESLSEDLEACDINDSHSDND